MPLHTFILETKANTKFHFGETGIESNICLAKTSDIFHSDSLFSAIVNNYAKFFGNADDFVKHIELFDIRFSSVFYVLEAVQSAKHTPIERLFFLPKPVSCVVFADENNIDYKAIKKIRFISQGLWKSGIAPKQWNDKGLVCILDKKFACLKEEVKALGLEEKQRELLKFYSINTLPKVQVHGASKADSFYHETHLHLENPRNIGAAIGVKLYFLADIPSLDTLKSKYEQQYKKQLQEMTTEKAEETTTTACEKFMKDLSACIQLLPDTGIGGGRSTGSGVFEAITPVAQTWDMEVNSTSDYCSLSLSIPKDEEEFKLAQAYQLVWRGGRALSNIELKNRGIKGARTGLTFLKETRMITEGAIFKQEIQGHIQEIGPTAEPASYLRFGKCLSFPISTSLVTMKKPNHPLL